MKHEGRLMQERRGWTVFPTMCCNDSCNLFLDAVSDGDVVGVPAVPLPVLITQTLCRPFRWAVAEKRKICFLEYVTWRVWYKPEVIDLMNNTVNVLGSSGPNIKCYDTTQQLKAVPVGHGTNATCLFVFQYRDVNLFDSSDYKRTNWSNER